MQNETFNCDKCLSQDPDQNRLQIRRQQKGCFKPIDRPIHRTQLMEFKRCPGNFRDPAFWYLWSEYLTFQKVGFNACDTPAKLIEALTFLDGLKIELDRKKINQQSRSNGRRNKNRR